MKNGPRNDDARISDILHAATAITTSLQGVSRSKFDKIDDKKGFVIYQILIIGEAAHNLSKEFKDAHSSIEWGPIVDMRNFVAHHYWNVDYDVVWQTAKRDVPELARYLRAIKKR